MTSRDVIAVRQARAGVRAVAAAASSWLLLFDQWSSDWSNDQPNSHVTRVKSCVELVVAV